MCSLFPRHRHRHRHHSCLTLFFPSGLLLLFRFKEEERPRSFIGFPGSGFSWSCILHYLRRGALLNSIYAYVL